MSLELIRTHTRAGQYARTHTSTQITTPLSEAAASSVPGAVCRKILRNTSACRPSDMRPPISVSLEPGLERGVPWGRDLYTFVTSAAGHMMRTLQKPRKNRPSKRQVNHRRFLHNMIQRKFADIEAANHRLASALYVSEDDKNTSSPSGHKPETPDGSGSPSQSGCLQDPDKCGVHTDTDGASKLKSDVSTDLREVSEKRQPDLGHLCKRHPKSQPSTCIARINNQSKRRQKKDSRSQRLAEFTSVSSPKGMDFYHGTEPSHEYYNDESPFKAINGFSEDTQNDSSFIQFTQNVDTSLSFSPELSPLSLDSCDLSIQMLTDVGACTQTQRSITDVAEGQLTDIMDLFSVGNKDLGGCMDVEAYFESIFTCQDDAGLEVGAGDVTFADQSDSLTEVEDLQGEGGDYRQEYGYSCQGDQGLTTNLFESNQRSSQTQRQRGHTAEEEFNSLKTTQSRDVAQNHLPSSITYHYNVAQLQTYQHPQPENHCMLLNCENHLNFTPFEGVAQSFSAPLHNPEHRSIPTPPHEDDWLFTDILKDGKSPSY